MLGMGDPDYKIEAEFVYPKHFHKRGALAAAREGDSVNPEKKSSGSQFYIVTGKTFTEGQLDQMDARRIQQQKQNIFNALVMENRDTIMALRRDKNQAALQQLQDKLIAATDSAQRLPPDTLNRNPASGLLHSRRHPASRRLIHRVRRSDFWNGCRGQNSESRNRP